VQAYDLIMLIVIGMATIFGAIKGFAWQVASLASIVVSYIVAYRFRFDVAEMIQAKPPWNQFLAMLILFVGTSFVIWVGFRLLSGTIDRVRLKEFDRHLGAAFGFAKGLVYCLLITMFATSLLGPNQQAAICQSRSGYYIATALDRGVGILPQEIHDVVGPYLTQLDERLKNGGAGAADGTAWPGGLDGIPNIPESLQSSLQPVAPAAGSLNPAIGNTNASSWGAPENGTFLNSLPNMGNVPGMDANPNSGSNLSGFGSLFPQNANPGDQSPQVYPPLGAPGSPPSSGLRPVQSPPVQQAQQPGFDLRLRR
jgi:membrane protein required for colicin V production